MSGEEQGASELADLTVVDTDFHLTDPVERYVDYIDPPYGEFVSGKLAMEHHQDVFPYPGMYHPGNTLGRIQNPSVDSVDDVADAMALLDTDYVVATPSNGLYFGMVHHEQIAAAMASGYNQWALDTFADEHDSVYTPIVVAPQAPQKAAEEIDDLKHESKMPAVFIPGGGVNPPLGDERYFPIYEACDNAGLPVLIHNAASGIMASFPQQYQAFRRYLPAHVTSHPMQHMVHLASMLTTGVPVRYPNITFVVEESGLGWIPWFMYRFDWEYAAMREDAPLLEESPSHYLMNNFKYTSQPVEGLKNPDYIRNITRFIEAERNLMFSSDFPHQDFDHTSELHGVLSSSYSDDAIENIFGGTAMELFDL